MQGLSHSQQAALDAMGITRWHRQVAPMPAQLQIVSADRLNSSEAKLLDAMLAAIDLTLGADVQLVSSPDKALQQAVSSPYWLVLGAEVAATLWGSAQPLETLRGQWHPLNPDAKGEGPTILVTEPLAELLRMPTAKARAWEDLRLLRRALQEAG
ncbi:MAG: hypothetical protein KGY57_01615 [Gammaproteobacteria bacterium]|nr:hypothetical protein [Gammaproteobacteria bacterium]